MWTPVVVPFQNSQPLPTLPTTDEIRACTNVLWETMASKVVALNDDIVVKYGRFPAPRLYAMYHDSEQLFLIMQRNPRVQLDSIWPSLAPSEKDDIIAKLQRIFDAIQHGDGKSLGPFSGEPAFVAGLTTRLAFTKKYLARVLQGHRPTLTHGGVQQKNIMVVENTSRPNDQGGRSFDVVLVDWENSGWFPDFWEFFCASYPMIFQWDEDWSWRVQEFVEVWPAEMAMMQLIDKELGW
ncbi:hypothetical protein AOCH_005112 [Aspergillus ochraceoroseus]|uniref:Aminoglycoside phosphotransferase domain-containing protein n=1 Tax=Aspergillus ochraceoroseus TaxID=138278 RepID=A0A0F8US31_9EURO|nr:hypothetical protein AOCH_005112 [Aspergillus ochraceoroseus]